MQNFDKSKYLGSWYEAMRTKGIRFEKGEGVVANYSVMEGGYVRVRNSIQDWTDKKSEKPPIKDQRRFANGWAIELHPDKKDGQLGVKFSIFQPWYADYNVLDTDYDTYTIVYGHTNGFLWLNPRDYAWVLTREPLTQDSPKRAEIIEKAKQVFAERVPHFKFDEQMRDTLQGADLSNVDYSGIEAPKSK